MPFALFVLFYAYRIYFWGDFNRYGIQEFINAIGDTAISWLCGYVLYKLNERYAFFRKLLHIPSLVIIGLACLLLFGYHYVVYASFNRIDRDFASWFYAFCFQLLDSVAVIITGSLVHIIFMYGRDKKKLQNDVKELTSARNQAELNFLKSRIDPHFIFNGLNNIFHEIEPGNERARSRILQFSDIMRYHLQHAEKETVDAEVELKYLQSFVDFQYARMSDFLEIEQKFVIQDTLVQMEPFLFLPFLENAFKFCVPKGKTKGFIRLKLLLNKEFIDFKLSNTYNPEMINQLKGNCFGLDNVIKRLKLIYGERYQLSLDDDRQSHVYYCHLKVLL